MNIHDIALGILVLFLPFAFIGFLVVMAHVSARRHRDGAKHPRAPSAADSDRGANNRQPALDREPSRETGRPTKTRPASRDRSRTGSDAGKARVEALFALITAWACVECA